MARRFHRKQDEETNYWLSYSDMMAGLLLCFVLIISLSVLHARVQYDEKETELLGKEQELIVQSDALRDERATVAAQQSLLEEQQATLEKQQSALVQQQKQISEQEETLKTQYALLDELREIMDSQQERLDRIIGVRTELIEKLKEEFDDSNLHLMVDQQTGAITFDSSILFEYNKDELKESGKTFLAQFLPRYVNILMSSDYRQYVSEIIIEGHTDTQGDYLFNLELSQKRAFSVAEYCLSKESGILTEKQLEMMQEVVTTNGKSFSNPVLTEDGEVDMEASRRVDFQFRLKDEEMIREMIEILSSDKNS
ncbi:MAG: OmpA family protein [Lachnospiraceae bacterium]|nr:OmpA family protein [Lachnospiraceae bacterium]